MVNVVDNSEAVNINVFSAEDFTTYIHTPSGDPYLTVDPMNQINIIDLPRDATSALKKAYTIGAFDLKFHMNLSNFPAKQEEGGAIFLGPAFRRDEGVNWPAADGTGAIFLLVRTYGGSASCRLVNRSNAWNTPEGVGPEMYMFDFIGHDFFIHMHRDITSNSSTLTVEFYDDFNMTIPSLYIDSNVVNLPLINNGEPDLLTFPYFVPIGAFNGQPNPDYYASGILNEFNLQLF